MNMAAARKRSSTPGPVTDADVVVEIADRDERTSRVIEMYQEGARLVDITRETGVPRATIYFLLRRNGISTDRLGQSGDAIGASELLTRLQQSERENGVLRNKIEKLEAIIEYLSAFTKAVRPADDRAPARPRRS